MPAKKIFFAPLGCAKNQVDGELMIAAAVAAGHEIVDDAARADVLAVNTCAFIDVAREESVDAILELARFKEDGSGRRLVVTGCLAERYAPELAREIPEIDALVGTGAIDRFVDALDAATGTIFKGAKHYLPSALMDRVVTEHDGSAYLKVSEGCDHECAFCVIPQIRGAHESRPLEDVACEAERLAARGIVELNLIAQDLSAYGRDLGMKAGLAELLYRLARIRGIERIRCFYLYPNTVDDEAIEAMARIEVVCKYVDMPLQHADSAVLRRMRRARDTDALRRIVGRFRERLGDPVLRTAFITGFPGETDEAFSRLLEFVEEMRFDHMAAFRYSHEEGSAAERFDGRVPQHVAQFRRDRLLAAQEPIAEERLARWIGRRTRVLVCGRAEDGCWYGRTDGQAPEIDGVTWLAGDWSGAQGRCVDATIIGSDVHDLHAERA